MRIGYVVHIVTGAAAVTRITEPSLRTFYIMTEIAADAVAVARDFRDMAVDLFHHAWLFLAAIMALITDCVFISF